MKILMAAPFDPKGRFAGGIMFVANTLVQNINKFNKKGVELSCFETCRIVRDEKSNSFNFANVQNALKIYFELSKEIKESKADVLYYHTSIGAALLKDLLAIRRAKKKTKVKTVIHIHFADYEKIINKKFEKVILSVLKKYVDEIVFLSKKTKNEFISRGISEEKCHVIYNFSAISLDEVTLKEKLNKSRDNTHFLFVGSIDERKGIFDALDCFLEIQKDYIFHVCGTCIGEMSKKRFAGYREKLGERLQFHGYVTGDEKKDIYRQADVFLLPSYGEGMPIVILEALNTACAIITTNVGAIPEIVNEKNGKVILPRDKVALKDAISEYLNKEVIEELRTQQKYNYQASSQYSIESFISKIIDICK